MLAVVIGQWRGTGCVGSHAHLDRFGVVIFALNQAATADVAHAFSLCWFGLDVVDGLAFLASAAAAQARNYGFEGQFIAEYGIELDVLVRQELGQRLGLGHGAGKTVQKEPAFAAQADGAFLDHGKHGFVRDEFALAHGVEGEVEGRAAFASGDGFRSTKDVPGGKLASAETCAEQLGLGALADAGGAEQDEVSGAGLDLGRNVAAGGGAFEPCRAVVLCVHVVALFSSA